MTHSSACGASRQRSETVGPVKVPSDRSTRDATTVEIVFALVTGVVLAGLTMLVTASPVLLHQVHGPARTVWTAAASGLAGVVFVLRVGSVLWRYDKRRRALLAQGIPGVAAQPSQPGRTSPDS